MKSSLQTVQVPLREDIKNEGATEGGRTDDVMATESQALSNCSSRDMTCQQGSGLALSNSIQSL